MTLAILFAAWVAGALLVMLGAMRFGAWLDRRSDPDRPTRWNRERLHGRHPETRPD
jgi:hypothetical protein